MPNDFLPINFYFLINLNGLKILNLYNSIHSYFMLHFWYVW